MASQAELKQMLATCGIKNRGAPNNVCQQLMDSQGITSVEDLADLLPKYAKDMIKSRNNGVTDAVARLGVVHQRKVEALIWWVKDRKRHCLPTTVAGWTNATMRNAITCMDLENETKENDTTRDSKPGKIDTGFGWYEWVLGF